MGDIIDFEKAKKEIEDQKEHDRQQDETWKRIKKQDNRIPEDDDGN